MRNVTLEGILGQDYLNVWYDAITKHQDPGGMAGLRKINKIIDIFDTVGKIEPVQILCQKCAQDLGSSIDKYVLNEESVSFWMDDDLWNFIKQAYDKVQWSPMRAKLITDSYDYLDKIPEAKPNQEK